MPTPTHAHTHTHMHPHPHTHTNTNTHTYTHIASFSDPLWSFCNISYKSLLKYRTIHREQRLHMMQAQWEQETSRSRADGNTSVNVACRCMSQCLPLTLSSEEKGRSVDRISCQLRARGSFCILYKYRGKDVRGWSIWLHTLYSKWPLILHRK